MKRSKSDVGYDEQGGQGIQRCENCVYFVEPDSCRMVYGEINDEGVCSLFEYDNYKTASLNLQKGFWDKLATPQRGRIVSDRSLIMDDDISEDPALRNQKARAAHTKGIPVKNPEARDSHELEKNGMAELLLSILGMED